MQAEIVLAHGQAKLLRPIYLKPEAPAHFCIEVPDDAIMGSRDIYTEDFVQKVAPHVPTAEPGSLQERLNHILGKFAIARPGASIGDDYQTLQDALEERYNGR
ncbi:MAG: hypothetical protein BWK76_24230 [Desulfobulbaceae bacterium A2]|nr:MAG: hypothetical protein BWK76_24230 [Desulfobulbaceae bacterium A2]